MTYTDPLWIEGIPAGEADFLRRLEAAAEDVDARRGALEDALTLRDDLIVRAIECYGERGSTGRGLLSTRQVARAAGISLGQLSRILANS